MLADTKPNDVIDTIVPVQRSRVFIHGLMLIFLGYFLYLGFSLVGVHYSLTAYLLAIALVGAIAVVAWHQLPDFDLVSGSGLILDQLGIRGTGDIDLNLLWDDIEMIGVIRKEITELEGESTYRHFVEITCSTRSGDWYHSRVVLPSIPGIPLDEIVDRIRAARSIAEAGKRKRSGPSALNGSNAASFGRRQKQA